MAPVTCVSFSLGVLLVFCWFGAISAAVYQSRLPEKPEEFRDKEGCYVKETNSMVDFGESFAPIGICYRVDCSRHGMQYASCGSVGTDDPKCYKTDEDLSQPYPSCCPTIMCDNNDIQ